MKDYITGSYEMFSGQAEAVQYVYRKVGDKEGNIWLYALNSPEQGSHIYLHRPKDTKSQGFGGSVLGFKLEDGTTYEAKGPWHSNSDSFFEKTGIDLRDKHLTFVVLGRGCEDVKNRRVIKDVVYQDDTPKLGNFQRYKEIIKQFPEATHYYMESRGGSSSGLISKEDRE